jgi:type I restriction-modification system DNA methylase subunit
MPTDHRAALVKVRRFDQLIAYLRDEMGWPIDQDSFDNIDELFYDFTPEELGIEHKNAAKIQEIRRLRPLSTHQPWGIFFVKFEPKRLPVVALRRILSQVTFKKRASANKAEQAAWSADDLLFISNYGEGENRQITFAHFSQKEGKKDLPTLKVLGWDNQNTALRLDHVAELLTEHLVWPDDEENENEWRRQWCSAFTEGHRQVITTSKNLSVELASLARNIRDRINTVLAIETENGPVTKVMSAFKDALIHDLDADGFADMYAQAIAYGLLSARVANPQGSTADDVATAMPVTNPFLKELMETFLNVGGRKGKAGKGPGLDFDELGVGDVVELLDAANMEAIVLDFGDKNPQEDPVIHFYELFLKEYDAKKRMQRGVFYTPRPVVSFIVRSVDELLRTEFGLEDGLADTTTWGEVAARFDDLKIPKGTSEGQAFVQILDPATGTGTFLVEVIDFIHKRMFEKWQAEDHDAKKIEELWNDYVPKHLLPRLHGYELMMAPYAIAHMKIGLKLYETGYRFKSKERVRVYLTNSLEPVKDFSGTLGFAIPALAHEAEAVNTIKEHQRFTVVIGNPPYAGHSANSSKDELGKLNFVGELLAAYFSYNGQPLGEKNPKYLQDDYVKFTRYAQWQIDRSSAGLVGMITNHSFLDNPTFRGMRESFCQSFQISYLLDLHGNLNRKEKAPGGGRDENIFDIRQGVSVSLHIKRDSCDEIAVKLGNLYGVRKNKLDYLSKHSVSTVEWSALTPRKPMHFFLVRDENVRAEYEQARPLREIFPVYVNGAKTHRDHFALGFTRSEILDRVNSFRDLSIGDTEIRDKYALGSWDFSQSRRSFSADTEWESKIRRVLYKPFDIRWSVYSPLVMDRPRMEVMSRMFQPESLGLVAIRQVSFSGGHSHFFVSRLPVVDRCFFSNKSAACVFPLSDSSTRLLPFGGSNSFEKLREEILELGQRTNDRDAPHAENMLQFIYATFHSRNFRDRYSDFITRDYPRVFVPKTAELLDSLTLLGGQLVALHLLESPRLIGHISTPIASDCLEVENVSYSDETVWIDKAKTRGFKGVPEEVWKFHIGGYQVCEKWLKDRQAKGGKNPRPGPVLTDEDIDHYQKIVVALSETIRIMAEIDEVIEEHGGWPDAFAPGKDATKAIATVSAADNQREFVYDKSTTANYSIAAEEKPVYEVDTAPSADGARPRADEWETEELIGVIRQVFSDDTSRGRDEAIAELASDLGYERVGARIREILDNAIRTAVRRGIVQGEGGMIRLETRSIEDYERDFLKDQFVASLQGHNWTEREDAIVGIARWLGFQRTGKLIKDTGKSLINGLIRDGRLETDASLIRRSK